MLRGVERGAELLTAGETLVIGRIAALSGPAGRLYARLTGRRGSVFPVDELAGPGIDDPDEAVAELVTLGLLDRFVPWTRRAAALPRRELAVACRRLGLPTAGRRAELEQRLLPHERWSDRRWVRVRHRALLRRLERWALLRREPDRAMLVVERLGHVRWPTYALTSGPGLHRGRCALLAWEGLWDALRRDTLGPEQAVRALADGTHRAAGRLDLQRRLRRVALEGARELERRDDPARARGLYEHLVDLGVPFDGVAVRIARTLEAEGRVEEALATLRRARSGAAPVQRIAIARAGRRIAGARGWAPDRPLARPARRSLSLPYAPPGSRPRYGAEAMPVEEAVMAHLATAGRSTLRAEGRLWTTLFGLLFADCYFLPVDGALPARFLSGPLDLGTPAFHARRQPHVDAVLDAVQGGEAPERIRRAYSARKRQRLAGVDWSLGSREGLAAATAALGPRALHLVLGRLLRHGWSAARGLPDLLILPGPRGRLPEAFPSRLPPTALLVEVKGPTDRVRDEQAVWFDRLLGVGAPVELWEVAPDKR